MKQSGQDRELLLRFVTFLSKHRYHTGAGILIFFWVLAYFMTGSKVEWGDFGFFAQAYETMRVSILHYHQFPWFNPWMSGGVPLYANPQMGVFSLQMLLVLIFGAVVGLKLALAVYTVLGYASMYFFLTRYFKIECLVATLLSLLWIFCSFFVAHLPAHFTFAWYMLSPAFFYLALTVRGWRSGLLFGVAFAVMAQSQLHNPFFHISFICTIIIVGRLLLDKKGRVAILKGVGGATVIFLILAGHRVLFTLQNVQDFPHTVSDPAPSLTTAADGPLLPLSYTHPFQLLQYPQEPFAPYGYGEVTATIGIFALLASFTSIMYVTYQLYTGKKSGFKRLQIPLLILGVAVSCGLLGLGRFAKFAPYNFLKHLPVFAEMRVSTRWFIFFDAALLIFVGLVIKGIQKRSFLRFFLIGLLSLGVVELFYLNVGYQGRILSHPVVTAPKPIWNYPFEQTSYFGQTRQLPTGGYIPNDGHMPHAYREYEATTWNLGILYANDSLVQLALDPRHIPGGHPTCPWEEGCNFVLSNNADVQYWSPNRIVLKRTGPGPIRLNMNDSDYFLIDGQRQITPMVVMPFTDFAINLPDNTKTITIQADPSLIVTLKDLRHKHQSVTYY